MPAAVYEALRTEDLDGPAKAGTLRRLDAANRYALVGDVRRLPADLVEHLSCLAAVELHPQGTVSLTFPRSRPRTARGAGPTADRTPVRSSQVERLCKNELVLPGGGVSDTSVNESSQVISGTWFAPRDSFTGAGGNEQPPRLAASDSRGKARPPPPAPPH